MGKIQFHPIIVAILLCEFDAIQGPRLALSTTSFDYLLNENPALNSNFSSSSSAPSQTSSESTDSTTYPIEDSSISPSSYVQSEPDTGDSLSTWRFLFDAVSEYLIPKPAFCGSFISVATDQFKVLGFPVLLEDPKYPRNTALWNVALVVPLNEDAQGLQPIVVKIARVFLSFEMECQFITNPNTRPVLKSILSQILLDLNTLRECRISLTPTTSLDLKLFPVYYNPPEVHLWDVPVPLLDLDLQQMEDWDITMKRVFAFIDGVHPIGIIADLADSNIELVKLCIQHLLYYGAVKLVDFFQFSNIYVVTPKLRQLARNERLQQECIQFVTYPGTF
ncbi:Nitrogen permease regulator 2 [Coelomomyces lativittatus]|nr:Nitrogen permease regulator 2 [Coelomomyces lativittatus]